MAVGMDAGRFKAVMMVSERHQMAVKSFDTGVHTSSSGQARLKGILEG
jgi:hypothetical protein